MEGSLLIDKPKTYVQRLPLEEILADSLYVGDANGASEYLKNNKGVRYTYVLHRPDGRPFYVGQGRNERVLHHAREARKRADISLINPYKINVIRAIWKTDADVVYRIDMLHQTKIATDEREVFLIANIGRIRDGGPLTNLTAGGDGGVDPSPEVKEKHRKTLGGIPDHEGERKTVNTFLLTFEPERGSIAIKPLSEITLVKLTAYGPEEKRIRPGSLSQRCATVLAVSAIVNGVMLKSGCRIPRCMEIMGVPAAIENGVGRRILSSNISGVIVDEMGSEFFLPNDSALEQVIRLVGKDRLESAGVLSK